MANKRKGKERGHEDLVSDVHQAMRSLGWVVPEYEDDVRQAEAELSAIAAPLPKLLGDAEAVFKDKATGGLANVKPISFSADPVAGENLARAARQGGKIPPEIEDRMHRDRQEAERKLDQGEDG